MSAETNYATIKGVNPKLRRKKLNIKRKLHRDGCMYGGVLFRDLSNIYDGAFYENS